ncbi:hypothetical protein CBM2637_A210083 [Cupriavidus taiwanensis]|nr:hypothetical protein CBM2637_A210083 [Cupriavidus taiwanensis]
MLDIAVKRVSSRLLSPSPASGRGR